MVFNCRTDYDILCVLEDSGLRADAKAMSLRVKNPVYGKRSNRPASPLANEPYLSGTCLSTRDRTLNAATAAPATQLCGSWKNMEVILAEMRQLSHSSLDSFPQKIMGANKGMGIHKSMRNCAGVTRLSGTRCLMMLFDRWTLTTSHRPWPTHFLVCLACLTFELIPGKSCMYTMSMVQ